MSLRAASGLLVFGVVVSGCQCDEVLGSRAPHAVLVHADLKTPPLERLDVDAGVVDVGSSVDVLFTLESAGNQPLIINAVTLIGDPQLCPQPSPSFKLVAPAPTSLDAGDEAPLTVRFTPSTGGTGCAVLAVDTDDEAHGRVIAVISGRGDAGALCTDRPVIDFGDVVVGERKSDVVELTSCGTRAVTINAARPNDQFPPFGVDVSGVLPITLAVGETVTLPVTFAPTQAGRHSTAQGNEGVLDVDTDLAGQLFQIALLGNGKNPPACEIDVAPGLVQFGFVQPANTATQPVFVRNLGELPCSVTGLALRDADDEFSAAMAVTTPFTLEPFSNVQVNITFTAPDAVGSVENALLVDSNDVDDGHVEVPIQAAVPSDEGCFVNAVPAAVDFGGVPLNALRTKQIVVENVGGDPCFLKETAINASSDPGFVDASSDRGMIIPGNSKELAVGFRTSAPSSTSHGLFDITVADRPFGGTDSHMSVPLSAFTRDPGICVTPRHIDFGDVDAQVEQTFQVSACGAATVTVTGLPFALPDAEFTISDAPSLPRTMLPGEFFVVTVRYTPVDEGADTAKIAVVSNDLVDPEVFVDVTGGHSVVPPEAGRFLYFWSIPGPLGGDVMKMPLQGADEPVPFWGPRNNKGCAGCHSISPDGKYVAVVEVGQMRFVEADTNLELFLGGTELLDPSSFSWRPNINTDPPYQYVYSNNLDILKGNLFEGSTGVLNGADDPDLIETMPSWGRDGQIAFVRGASTATTPDGNFGLAGATDILLIDEDGGVPVPVTGASENGFANYYPSFSPNGRFIAFTQSESATSTVAAEDACLRLANGSNNGLISTLDALNAPDGPSSYPTWSVDGSFLSFSSQRAGGRGNWDIYLGRIDPLTGLDLDVRALDEVNTPDFEHGALWSP